MSRKIDTTQPLSPEDEQYLADRDRTVEEEADRQREETGGNCFLNYDGPVVGDPSLARVRKARQL